MGLEDKAKAAAKNIEGKVQAAVGELTGDDQAVVEGKAKQVQASAMNAVENIKDQVKKVLD